MPILPFYAEEYGAGGFELGAIFTAYAAAQFALAPLWGRLSDRVGRRRILLCTVAGTSLALLLLGLADSLLWIFLARLLAGGFAANVSVASAAITDLTREDERTRWMGVLGACFAVGFVLGPALGGLLSPYGYAVPIYAAAGLAAANLVFAAAALRDPPRHASQTEAPRPAVLRDPTVRRLCLANLAFAVAVTQLETIFALFAMDRFGWDGRTFAFLLVGMAVVMGAIQGGGMRALAARFPERGLVVAGTALLAVSFALVPVASVAPALVGVLLLAAVGRAVAQPSLMSLASMAADAGGRGAVMGTFQSSASLARIIGPLAGGLLYDASQAGPFWLAAGLAAAVSVGGRSLPAREAAAGPVG